MLDLTLDHMKPEKAAPARVKVFSFPSTQLAMNRKAGMQIRRTTVRIASVPAAGTEREPMRMKKWMIGR